MKKINKLSDYSGEDNFTSVFLKLNEVIDFLNSQQEEKKDKKPCELGGVYDPQCKRCVEANYDQPLKKKRRQI